MRVVVLFALFAGVASHGAMQMPPSWQMTNTYYALGGISLKNPKVLKEGACPSNACEWYTNSTYIKGEPTIGENSPLRTYKPVPGCPMFKGMSSCWNSTPWRAPGTAEVFSPCGVEGGNPKGCGPSHKCIDGGFEYGPDGRSLVKGVTTHYEVGSIIEAGFSIEANHGGGYSYRLCPAPKSGNMSELTEKCFQSHHLDFVGNTSVIQFNHDPNNRTEIPAMRTSTGTYPPGSMWTRNPIPAGGEGGFGPGSEFPPPIPGIRGFGPVFGDYIFDHFLVIDKLQLPKTLGAGDYVISYRWDCEQTPQVWQQCGSISLVADSATPAPAPTGGPLCGDAKHACGFKCEGDSCGEWASNSICTLSQGHCECVKPNTDLNSMCCGGTWVNKTEPQCTSVGVLGRHACGLDCPKKDDPDYLHTGIPQCKRWAATGACTKSRESCTSQCSGTWVELGRD